MIISRLVLLIFLLLPVSVRGQEYQHKVFVPVITKEYRSALDPNYVFKYWLSGPIPYYAGSPNLTGLMVNIDGKRYDGELFGMTAVIHWKSDTDVGLGGNSKYIVGPGQVWFALTYDSTLARLYKQQHKTIEFDIVILSDSNQMLDEYLLTYYF